MRRSSVLGLLALVLALVSLVLGTAAAWYVIVQVFEFGWAPDWPTVLGTLAGGALLTLGIGIAGSFPLMALRPARARSEEHTSELPSLMRISSSGFRLTKTTTPQTT